MLKKKKKRDDGETFDRLFFTSNLNDGGKPHEDFELKREETAVKTISH